MKKKLLLSLFLGFAGILSAEGVIGTVNTRKDPLQLRLAAGKNAPVVGRAAKGSQLIITGKKGNWLEVAAPECVNVYVARQYIHNGKTTTDLTMRYRMDDKSQSLGKLPKGTAVKIIREHSYGWARIQAPESVRVYTFAYYVQYDGAALKKLMAEKAKMVPEKDGRTEEVVVPVKKIEPEKTVEEKPIAETDEKKPAAKADEKKHAAPAAKAVEKKPAAPAAKTIEKKPAAQTVEKKPVEQTEKAAPAFSESDPRVAELKKLEIDVFKAPVKKVTVRGTLVAVPSSANLATNYAIGSASTPIIGFVCVAEDGMVKPFVNKEVKLSGRQFKVEGWKSPIIWLDEIDLIK